MTRLHPLRFSACALALAAAAAFSVGCDSGTTPPGTDAGHTDGDGHSHAGHDHGGHAHDLAPMTIAGRTITLTVGGEIEPNAEAHIDVAIQGDPVDTVRLWIGRADDANPLKVNLGPTGGHAHAEAPADLDHAHIVVELDINGERYTGEAELPHHEGDDHEHDHEDGHDHDDHGGDHDHDGDGHPDH